MSADDGELPVEGPVAVAHLDPVDPVDPGAGGAVVWAGPEVASLAQVEGWFSEPPTWLTERVAVARILEDDGHVPEGGGDVPLAFDGTRLDDGEAAGAGVRGRVRGLQVAARALLEQVGGPSVAGELGALVELAAVADTVQAAMVELAARVQHQQVAQRRAGLLLVEVLALATRMTSSERRALVRRAADVGRLPSLDDAVHAGRIGAGEARRILASSRGLDEDGLNELDHMLSDHDQLSIQTADAVIDEIAARATQIADRRADDAHVKAFERRFVAVKAGSAGTVSGYLEIDDHAGALLLRALDDAAPPMTPARSLTRDAAVASDQVEPDRHTLGRRRADALVRLAEHWLASHPDPVTDSGRDIGPGHDTDPGRAVGARKRARPLVYVWTDIATLIGDDRHAKAARLLWDTLGPNPVLTPTAVRRLADDARLQFILTDGDEILGVAAPVDAIPAKVRAGVHARDHGCRFPGCAIPIHETDLHHVTGRAKGGHTTVDNLVALCRRHHTAVTDARWILTMTTSGHVKIRRGRHVATSDPPATSRL